DSSTAGVPAALAYTGAGEVAEGEAMTEAEWLGCTDPTTMLATLPDKTSERKLRLFMCACWRHIWPLLLDRRSRRAVETAERYADQLATEEELLQAQEEATRAARELVRAEAHAAAEAALPLKKNSSRPRRRPHGQLGSWCVLRPTPRQKPPW